MLKNRKYRSNSLLNYIVVNVHLISFSQNVSTVSQKGVHVRSTVSNHRMNLNKLMIIPY